jgi:hypothetical protein
MKFIINESQFELYKHFLKESLENESRSVHTLKGYKNNVQPLIDKLSAKLYGDEVDTVNTGQTDRFELSKNPILNNLAIKTGLFSVGNAKLSDDTLIINFTSALQCPSVSVCPVTQMACYAVAGENRLPDVRRKNLMIQNMWIRAIKNKAVGEVFGIAEMYIQILQNTKKPIRYIRFNEVGDFINQDILDAAALFASNVKEKYGVASMAYTSNNRLDFSKEINGTPIDRIIKINASRLDIKLSDESVKNKFLATPMDFESALAENDRVVSISEKERMDNNFQCLGVLEDPETGTPSIPVLAEGKWSGGSGWYYVCPCSFWRFNKDKRTLVILKKHNIVEKDIYYLSTEELTDIIKTIPKDKAAAIKAEIKTETNKVKSPCGTKCSVCHNVSGGVSFKEARLSPDKWHMITDYTVLESVHGSGSSHYKPEYANEKRKGNDSVIYSPENPRGRFMKFNK